MTQVMENLEFNLFGKDENQAIVHLIFEKQDYVNLYLQGRPFH